MTDAGHAALIIAAWAIVGGSVAILILLAGALAHSILTDQGDDP